MLRSSLFLVLLLLYCNIIHTQSINWQPLNEPGNGGRITDIAISPADNNHILIAGDMLGIAYSEDGGTTWLPTFGFESYEIGAITFHPTNDQIVWAGTMSGPYKSEDGGQTWEWKRNGMPPINNWSYSCPIEKILFDPSNFDRLLAFGGSKREWNSPGNPKWNSLWESLDGGETWAELAVIGIPAKPGITSATFAGADKIIAAVKEQGLYISTDGGQNWELSINGMNQSTNIISVAVDPANPDILFASTDNYLENEVYQPGGIYKSTDGGLNWTNSSTGLQQSIDANSNKASWYKTVKVAPSNSNILYTANSGWLNSGVYKSTDGGENWQAILNTTSTNNFPNIFFNNAGPELSVFDIGANDADLFIGGSSSYVLRTTNGGNSWSDLLSQAAAIPGYFTGNGFCGLVCRGIAFNPFDENNVVLQSMDNGKFMHSQDNMQSWKKSGEGMSPYAGGNAVTFGGSAGNIIYCTTGQSTFDGVWKSLDKGQTWTKFAIEAFPGADPNSRPLGIHTIATNTDLVWVVLDNQLYHSTNGGNTWSSILSAEGLNFIAAESPQSTHFYLNSVLGVYSTDNGQDFNLMANSPKNGARILVDPNDSNIIYVTKWRTNDDEEGLWKYDGNNWMHLREDYYLFDVTVQTGNSDVIAVATSDNPFHDKMNCTGVWLSTDGGETWVQEIDGLPMVRTNVIAFNPHQTDEILVGLGGRGFYRGNLIISSTKANNTFSTKISIHPNPNDGSFRIFNTSQEEEIRIFDLQGRIIHQQQASEGTTLVQLNTKSAGTYLLQIRDSKSEKIISKKIIKE